jgi:hypothetical protein
MKLKDLRKKVIVTFAVLLFAIASMVGVTYAYWNMLQVQQDETIEIGEGVVLEMVVVATAPAGKTLVPDGQILDSATQVDSITLTYNVKLDHALTTALTLGVAATNVKIGGSTDNASLVNIDISYATSINDTNVLVTVTITLDEPATEAVYDLVHNQPITFTLTFTATA